MTAHNQLSATELFFHVAPRTARESILKNGLRPQRRKNFKISQPGVVYLWDALDPAYVYAVQQYAHHGYEDSCAGGSECDIWTAALDTSVEPIRDPYHTNRPDITMYQSSWMVPNVSAAKLQLLLSARPAWGELIEQAGCEGWSEMRRQAPTGRV